MSEVFRDSEDAADISHATLQWRSNFDLLSIVVPIYLYSLTICTLLSWMTGIAYEYTNDGSGTVFTKRKQQTI